MVRRRTITSDARTRVPGGSRTGRVSRTPRAMPDDTEMSARASRLRAGRQSAGAGGRQGLAGSAMYSIQDMLNHPAVGFSRGMARGPAQGKVDAITNDVHKSLAEQGIFQGEDGTWQIDMAQNAAYREAKRGSSSVPGIPQAGGGLPGGILPRQTSTPNLPYPGPGKPSTPTGGTGTRMPGPPVGGGMPAPRTPSTTQAGPPVGPAPTTGGTLPRQGPIYTPKPAEPSDGTLPRQLPPGTLPRQTTPIGYDAQGNPLPKVAGPNPGGGGTLPRQSGPAQVPPGTQQAIDVFRQGQQPQPKPPGGIPGQPQQPPRPGMPSPTGRPQAPTWPTMPNGQQMGQGNTSDLGGQIQARVNQMLASRMNGAAQGAGQAGTGAMQGLAGLGDRISQQVQSRLGPRIAGGAPTDGVGNPSLGGLAGLGDRIQQQVQGRIAGMPRPGMPNIPQPGMPNIPGGPAGPAPGNPGGGAGMPPGPGTIPQPPGGPAPGNPSPVPPTGPGTGTGTLGSYGNASIDQWDSAFIAAGNATGVDPRILKAMAEIESGGNGNIPLDQCRDDGYGDGGSCGLMQIKPNIWGSVGSTEEQIMQAAKILADYKAANPGATDKDALFAVYFPADDPNGTTQGSYSAKVDQLVTQMGDYNPGGGTTTPIEPGGGGNVPINQNAPIPNTADSSFPGSAPNQEPVAQMTPETVSYLETMAPGAGQAAINNDYGYKSQGPRYYCNYVNWQCDMHTGLDVPLGQNQEYNGLVSGKVVCVGGATSASYDGAPYQCGSYDTDDGTGIGNITVRTPKGAYVTYGHTQANYVQMDQQVTPGQPIGTAGYANGYHVHLEVRLPIGQNGDYMMVDPNLYFNGYYCNIGFCPE